MFPEHAISKMCGLRRGRKRRGKTRKEIDSVSLIHTVLHSTDDNQPLNICFPYCARRTALFEDRARRRGPL
jgi:hypothetical protein